MDSAAVADNFFTREKHRSNILTLIANNTPLTLILTAIARGVETFYPDMLCSILLLDNDQRTLHVAAAPKLPDFYNQAINGIKIGPSVGSCGTAAHLGKRIIVENIQTDPLWVDYKELAAKAELAACWSEPIRTANGKVLGTFALYHRKPHSPNAQQLESININALLASIAIERAHINTHQKHIETELENLQQRQSFLLNSFACVSYRSRLDDPFNPYWYSENLTEQTGYTHEEVINTYNFWLSKHHPDDYAIIHSNPPPDRALNNTLQYSIEYRVRFSKYQTWRWILDAWQIYFNHETYQEEVMGFIIDITEEKETELKLKSVQRNQLFLLKSVSAVNYVCGIDENFTTYWVSDNFSQVSGHAQEEILNNPSFWIKTIHPDDRKRIAIETPPLLHETGSIHIQEYRVKFNIHQDWRLFQDTWHTVFNHEKNRQEIIGFWIDITEQRVTEEQYKTLQKQQSMLLKSTSAVTYRCLFDENFTMIWASENYSDLTGYSMNEALFNPNFWHQNVHPEDRATITQEIEFNPIELNKTYTQVYRYQYKNGSYHWLHDEWKIVFNEQTNQKEIVGCWIDITTQKQTEIELARTNQLLQASQRMAKVGGWEIDLINQQLFWTDETYRIHDLTPEEYTPTVATAINFYAPTSIPLITQAVESAIAFGTNYDLELELITAKNRHIWVHTAGTPIGDERGNIIKITGSFQDITDRKYAQQKIIESETKLATIINNVLDAVVLMDANGFITGWNRHAETIFGWSTQEALGTRLSDLIIPKQHRRAHTKGLMRFMATGDSTTLNRRIEVMALHRQGYEFPIELAISPITTKEQYEFNAFIRDISERKQFEASLQKINAELDARVKIEVAKNIEKDQLLQEQSRIASMGEMIGNIAHQWRQPLNSLGLILADLEDAFNHQEINQDYLASTLKKSAGIIQNMSNTIDDFRDFFKTDHTLDTFSVKKAVDTCLQLIEASLTYNKITVAILCPQDILIYGNSREFSQVILNLLSNAKDAILNHTTQRKHIDIEISSNDQYGLLSITDTGGGIPIDARARIFEPYFTTKPQGVGIGLYMAHTIMTQKMNGFIRTQNKKEGAQFTIWAPLYKVEDVHD